MHGASPLGSNSSGPLAAITNFSSGAQRQLWTPAHCLWTQLAQCLVCGAKYTIEAILLHLHPLRASKFRCHRLGYVIRRLLLICLWTAGSGQHCHIERCGHLLTVADAIVRRQNVFQKELMPEAWSSCERHACLCRPGWQSARSSVLSSTREPGSVGLICREDQESRISGKRPRRRDDGGPVNLVGGSLIFPDSQSCGWLTLMSDTDLHRTSSLDTTLPCPARLLHRCDATPYSVGVR